MNHFTARFPGHPSAADSIVARSNAHPRTHYGATYFQLARRNSDHDRCATRIARVSMTAWLLALSTANAQPPTRGAIIATQGTTAGIPACINCHGAHGEGNAQAGFPRLAGLPADYLAAQLNAFATGQRQSPLMTPFAQLLAATDRHAVAHYFSQLPAARGVRTPRANLTPANTGAWLAARGRWQQGVPACAQCHGVDGTGTGSAFPPLAGQPAAYIARQLHLWRHGARPPGPLALMPLIASKLSAAEITAVAYYYADQVGPAAPALITSRPDAGKTSTSGLPAPAAAPTRTFTPPSETAIPNDSFGDMVKQGERIFTDTQTFASRYVNNALSCANCHLDKGRQPNASPLWGAYPAYPAYRKKNGRVNTFAERLQGCFRYSMNGIAPPLGHPILVALETYAYWLAKGAPLGQELPGRGYLKLAAPAQAPNYARGSHVYAHYCALCHGSNGQGLSSHGKIIFPPLWGPASFNWGAGMHELHHAAGFIKANMPLGLGGTLTDQQAWDVAAFMNSHERPQDPRFTGSVATTRAKYHDTPHSMYGKTINGYLLGSP